MEAPAICYLSVASIWAGHDHEVNTFACGPQSRGRNKNPLRSDPFPNPLVLDDGTECTQFAGDTKLSG